MKFHVPALCYATACSRGEECGGEERRSPFPGRGQNHRERERSDGGEEAEGTNSVASTGPAALTPEKWLDASAPGSMAIFQPHLHGTWRLNGSFGANLMLGSAFFIPRRGLISSC